MRTTTGVDPVASPPTTTSAIDRLAGALLVRPGEGRRTALLFAHLLLASAVFVMGRTVRDTLFLSRFSIDALPWMFVLYGVASAITVLVYGRVADRLPRERAIVVWSVIGIASYLGVWLAVQAALSWVYPVFYVWSEVFANLAISQFWTLANELHDARSAKRLFGTIGAARVLGVIVVGLGTGSIVRAIGTPQLLFLLAGLQVAIAAIAMALSREPRASKATSAAAAKRAPPPILASRYVWALAAMMLFAFAALTIGDFQFKAIARATYQEDALAQFFSYFYAVTGIVSFLFQLVVTPRLLARFGVGAGMSVMPSVFGLASAALLGVPALMVASVMKFADNGFQYTIHETTLQALYVPFPAVSRARTRAFLDAVAKPLAYGAGGLLLVAFAHRLPTEQLSLVSVVLVLGWAATIPMVRRLYRRELERTLGTTGTAEAIDAELVGDADARQLLESALSSSDDRTALAAVSEASLLPQSVVARPLARAVAHPSPAVRIAAMDQLAAWGAGLRELAIDAAPIRANLVHGVPEVRASAASAIGSLLADDANDLLARMLDDAARPVRTSALAALLVHGGLDGAMTGGARLEALLASADADDRMDAAAVLETLGAPGYRKLRGLLDDHDARVRRAAVRAARGCPDRRLVDPLLDALRDPLTEAAATRALASIGTAAAPRLVAMLASPDTSRRARLQIPRVLRQIPCDESWQGLRRVMDDTDSHLRLRVYSALSVLRVRLERAPFTLDELRVLLDREIRETLLVVAGWARARTRFPSELFDEAIAFRELRGSRRVLRILELRYPSDTLRLVRERLEQPTRRANALEVLDNTLESSLRGVVMPFFDDVPIAEKVARAHVGPVLEPLPFLETQLQHPNPFVVLLAFDVLGRVEPALACEQARAQLGHREPLVREAAVHAIVRGAADPGSLLEPLLEDPDPVVRRMVRGALTQLEQAPSRVRNEVPMESTIEKLLALRAAPVFEKLRSEDLAALARIAEIETFEPGATIFSEGEMGDALYVVVRGAVEIRHEGRTLATLRKGEPFGEMAVLDAEPRSATAVAAEPTEALRIASDAFYDLLHEQAEIAEGIIRTLSARLREANAMLEHERESVGPKRASSAPRVVDRERS